MASLGRIDLVHAAETLTAPTDWRFEEPHHTFVVHLGGRLDRMECEFSSGPSGMALPSTGDVWTIPAGCRYAALAQGEHAEFIEFKLRPDLLDDADLRASVQNHDAFLYAAAQRLSGLLGREQDDLAAMAAHAISNALEMHFLERYGHRPSGPSRRRQTISPGMRGRLVEIVRDQPEGDHSLASLAAIAGMDVRRFSESFARAFGMTPWQYVLRARLQKASELLRDGTAPVTEIALSSGFASSSHFATAFTRHYGVSPTRYRRMCR